MNKLFPAIKPYVNHTLKVEEPHVLHVEECGNPDGIPVVFLHGGPGAGYDGSHRRFFDPEVYRIVLFDQRGSGRSVPHAELKGNTTQSLVADMEAIREHLAIEKWVLFGGSWGSSLALVYAQTYPERVLGLILRGIFLCRPRDIQWFYQDGACRVFPEYWRDFQRPIPEAEQGDMVAAYYRRLTGQDELARMAAAKAWSIWEARCATMKLSGELVNHLGNSHVALSMARIECHYFTHQSFLRPNQILDDMEKIRHLPATIIHGRYDVVCPVEQAIELSNAWPDAELRIIADAGHSAFEPGIVDALVTATRSMARHLT
jgi:proline iminopeptidase